MPVIEGGGYGYEHVNVAQQRRDPDSLLNWMKRVIRMRKELPEVGWGDFKVLPQRNPALFVLRYDWRNNAVFLIHNLGNDPVELEVANKTLGGTECERLINLLSEARSEADGQGRHTILPEPYGYRWFRAGGLDYLLKRSAVRGSDMAATSARHASACRSGQPGLEELEVSKTTWNPGLSSSSMSCAR